MTYKELIEKLAPYAEEEVDACISFYLNEISFWIGVGETEIATIKFHD